MNQQVKLNESLILSAYNRILTINGYNTRETSSFYLTIVI